MFWVDAYAGERANPTGHADRGARRGCGMNSLVALM
jgi:hypothetical protein